LAAVFLDHVFPVPETLCARTPLENVTIVPSNQHLAAHNTPCPQTTGLQQFALQSCMELLPGFDLALIDCPPNLYQCSWNALVAADFVIVPVPPEDFGTQGLHPVQQAIEGARLLNPRLSLLGHLVTRSDGRLLVHRTYEQHLRRLYGPTVFHTVIPEASAFKVSLACRKPVSHYAPRSKAAFVMRQLKHEILARIEMSNREEKIA
jgi:chromosome partitioning protein